MITGFFIWLATITGKLVYDRHRYLSRKVIHHGKEAVIVSILLLVASYFGGWKSAPLWFFGMWVLFDGFFNLLIGQPWGFVGETAQLDKLMRKYPFIIFLKYMFFFASIIIIFV